MKMRVCVGIVCSLAIVASNAFAQNPSSNKAFFATAPNGLIFTTVGNPGVSPVVELINVPAALKTSNGGAVSAILSMETLLSTYNITTALQTTPSTRNSSSARATIKAWIELDGNQMDPGEVVFNDRLQATGLTLNLTCSVPGTTCTVGGDVVLELFQATKSANSFTFFLGPLGAQIHSLKVKAQAQVECRQNGVVIPCPTGTLDAYAASTQAALGKITLLIEEQQNWGKLTVQ